MGLPWVWEEHGTLWGGVYYLHFLAEIAACLYVRLEVNRPERMEHPKGLMRQMGL